MKRIIQRTDIEASESCVGLSVSIPHFTVFSFPSVSEKVKVGRGVERRRGKGTEGVKQKCGVPWSSGAGAAEAGQGRAQAGSCWTAGTTSRGGGE